MASTISPEKLKDYDAVKASYNSSLMELLEAESAQDESKPAETKPAETQDSTEERTGATSATAEGTDPTETSTPVDESIIQGIFQEVQRIKQEAERGKDKTCKDDWAWMQRMMNARGSTPSGKSSSRR